MKELDTICETGLRFFGKVSASISHEIKNALAVINENAGLLEDLTLMAEKGMELDPIRVRGLAEKFMEQVRRSDGIVKNLNRFAHSSDDFRKKVDVAETAEFTVRLAARLGSARGVAFHTVSPKTSIYLVTSPFFLEAVIFRCLEIAMEAPGVDKTVHLTLETLDDGAHIRFTGLALNGECQESPFTHEDQALFDFLNAEVDMISTKGEIVLKFKDMNSSI